MVNNLPANTGDAGSIPGLGRSLDHWRGTWQPTLVFLPGKFHRQRSLVGYSPGGRKESDSKEQLNICIILANLVFHNSIIVLM